MERPDGRAGLRLDGPRRPVLGELEQEAPEAPAPAKQPHPFAALGVPEVVTALGDRRQQLGPLAAHAQLGTLVVFADVGKRVPGRHVCRETGEDLLPVLRQRLVGGCGEAEVDPIARANDEDPLAQLRHAVVGGIEPRHREAVAGAPLAIEVVDRAPDQLEPLALAAVGQTGDVFEQEGTGEGVAQHPQVGAERAGARVVEAQRVALGPVAGLRERLAGRAADQHVGITLGEPGGGKQLVRADGVDVAVENGPRAIGAEGDDRLGIELDRGRGVKARGLEAEVEAACTGVETDRLRHRNYACFTPFLAALSSPWSVLRMSRATASGEAWIVDSQTRRTVQPAARRAAVWRRSRAMFASILAIQ